MKNMAMKFICSLITVEDIKRSREFYEKLLGQKVEFDHGENILFEGGFAIHLKSHFSRLINDKKIKSGGNNFELYFESDDVIEIQKKLKDNGVKFIHDLKEQPWRQRVLRCYDPDKNIVEIGESLEYLCFRLSREGHSVEDILKITNMPENFIIDSIKSYNTTL